jgi:hypothetical protein
MKLEKDFSLGTLPAVAVLVIGLELRWAFVAAPVLGGIAGVSGYLFAFFRIAGRGAVRP